MRFLETTGAECNGQVIPFRRFGPKILNQPAPLFTGDHYWGKLGWERGKTPCLFSSASRCHSTFSQLFSRSPVTGADMVRNAKAGDIPALIELGARMYIESRYSQNSPFDEEKCAELARNLISSPAGCLLVAEKDGAVIGWLAGGIAEQWFSRQLMAFEYGLFIAPEHRGGTAGPRLAKAFITWAEEHGAAIINMGITTGVHEERTGDLYSRLGLSRTGLLYSKRCNDVYWVRNGGNWRVRSCGGWCGL
jgi:GNAT superfamily N-acetyltransferase